MPCNKILCQESQQRLAWCCCRCCYCPRLSLREQLWDSLQTLATFLQEMKSHLVENMCNCAHFAFLACRGSCFPLQLVANISKKAVHCTVIGHNNARLNNEKIVRNLCCSILYRFHIALIVTFSKIFFSLLVDLIW